MLILPPFKCLIVLCKRHADHIHKAKTAAVMCDGTIPAVIVASSTVSTPPTNPCELNVVLLPFFSSKQSKREHNDSGILPSPSAII